MLTRNLQRRRALVLSAVLTLGIGACQGEVPAPQLDNPNDPRNGQAPPVPTITNLTPSNCGSGVPSVTIAWDIESEVDVEEYQIFRTRFSDTDPGDLILHVPVGTLSVIDNDGLDEARTYYYRVRAISTEGAVGLRSERAESISCN